MGHDWATKRPFSLPGDFLGRYEPVLPGDPSFVCQALECGALCCRALSVPLDEQDVGRMERHSGLVPSRFLECEDGRPIALPLVDPYLLAREEGHCVLLGPDLDCSQYEGRPDACRAYPFQVILAEPTGNPLGSGSRGVARAHQVADEAKVRTVLLRHLDCPGFTGPPIDVAAWHRLVSETASLAPGD